MTLSTFTPEQQTLRDALVDVDAGLLAIVRDIMTQWLATGLDSGPDPEDIGAPVDTPAWAELEQAFVAFEEAATGDDEAITRAALDVTNDVLVEMDDDARAAQEGLDAIAAGEPVVPWEDVKARLELDNCLGCAAAPGQPHGEDCDHARCPDCGEQLLFHECEYWPDDGPERPAIWHGIDQRAEVARKLNWWTTAVGIDHLVEDYTRVLIADALGQISWDQQAQRYTIGQIDNAELDRAVAESDPWGRPTN